MIWWVICVSSLVEAANIEVIHNDCSDLRQKLTNADSEIDRLRQENKKLKFENDQLQRILEMSPPVPNYDSFQEKGLQHPPDSWDWSGSTEPRYASNSIHVEVTELENELEKTKNELQQTQDKLQLSQSNYDQCQTELKQMREKVL